MAFLDLLLLERDSSMMDSFYVMYFFIFRVFFYPLMLKGLLIVSYIFSSKFFFFLGYTSTSPSPYTSPSTFKFSSYVSR